MWAGFGLRLDLARQPPQRDVKQEQETGVRITVLASMRNEGPFIVEWVCWYRMLGFTDIVVVTNNCTDHSPLLLDALQAAGWLHHIRHDIAPGQRITRAKLAAARDHKAVRRANWLMVCDVDEFLVIHRGNGMIADLIDLGPEPAYLGMSINWRVFGTSNRRAFEDRPVHRQFLYACAKDETKSRFIKSIYRMAKYFGGIGEHTPRRFGFEKAGKVWGEPGMIWVNSAGHKVARWAPRDRYMTVMPLGGVTHEVAQINHYQLRSEESFSLKKGTLSPVGLENRYREVYFEAANAGQEVDTSAFRYSARFDALYAAAMALPDVARLHALCCADHVKAIVEKAGGRAEDDPRYAAFLQAAAAMAKGAAGFPAAPQDPSNP